MIARLKLAEFNAVSGAAKISARDVVEWAMQETISRSVSSFTKKLPFVPSMTINVAMSLFKEQKGVRRMVDFILNR